jgi:hypothetical protein
VTAGSPAAPTEAPVRVAVNPFPGPRAYRGDQEQYFFGRTEEIEELAALLLSTSATLLYAPSGTGKSSLLHAGLAPYLAHRFDFVVLPTVHVGRGSRTDPDHRGTNQFVRLVCEAISGVDGAVSADIAAAARSRRPEGSRRVLLILDQFEEVFDDPALWRDREEFFAELTRALAGNTWLRVIIALRSDYLAELVPYERHLPNNLVVRYQLESLTDEQAQQAISSAFAATDVGLPDVVLHDLLDALLEEAPGPGGPATIRARHVNTVQLQITCRRLWQELKDTDSPEHADLPRSVSSLRSSMSSFVDEAIAEVVGRDRTEEAAVRWWLEEHLITSAGRRAFVLVGEDETAGLPNALVEALEGVRLVQVEQRHGSRLVELTHDSMVDGVRASNEPWRQRRYRRQWRRRAVLAALLAGVLALFPYLRVDQIDSEVRDGTTANGEVRERFTAQADSMVVEIDRVQQPLRLRIVSDNSGPNDSPLAEQDVAAEQTTPTAIAVRTTPGRVYAVVLTSTEAAVGYRLTLTPLPTMPTGVMEQDSVSSRWVVLDLEPGRRELVRVGNGDLTQVAGVQPIVLDTYSDRTVVEGSGVVALRLESKQSLDAPTAATVRRQVLDNSGRLPVGLLRQAKVTPPAVAYVPFERSEVPFGAGIWCNDVVEAQLVGGAQPDGRITYPTTVGPEGTVLPVVPGPVASGLVLSNYYSTDSAADCTVDLQPRQQEATLSSFGRTDLVISASSSAAFPIALPRDAVLVADPSDAVTPWLYCGSEQAESPTTASDRFLAVAPAGSSCVLWLVKKDPHAGPATLSLWVAEGPDRGGR